MKALGFAFAFFLFLCSANCKEIFVQSGASAGNGTNSLPYGTIQEALIAAASNDVITLYDGTYNGTANTMLTLGSLKNITIRGQNNDPALAVIQWSGPSYEPFLSTNATGAQIKIQGIGFYGRILSEDNSLKTTPTFSIVSGSLDISNSRFESFSSINTAAILYVLLRNSSSTVTIKNTDFIRGTAPYGIQVDGGTLIMDSCNFVSHPGIGTSAPGTVLYTRDVGNVVTANISNTNIISSQSALKLLAGNITLTSNNFYNTSQSVACNTVPGISAIGNKFCGSSNSSCSLFSQPPIRAFDGCGVCDGTNVNKDCNGVCWGTNRGSSCNTKKTIWVSPTGIADGTAKNKTMSLTTAINQANYGDTIILAAGNYSGGINTQGKGITIKSENGLPEYDNVTISCAGTTAFTFSNRESFDTVIQGITITNCGNQTVPAVVVSADTGVTFKAVNFNSNGNIAGPGTLRISDGFVRMDDVTFFNNSANVGAGVSIYSTNYVTKVAYVSATNTRFIKQYVAFGGGGVYCDGGLVEISSSFFTNSYSESRGAALYTSNCYHLLVNNSFSNINGAAGSGKSVYCTPIQSTSSQSSNTFCGGVNTTSVSCDINSTWVPSLSGTVDNCGVCNGNNATLDCSGTCWGKQSKDSGNSCCFTPSRDCNGTCFGTKDTDVNKTCCEKSTIDICNLCGGQNDCLCDKSYNPYAPVCLNSGFCVPQPNITLIGAYCDCSLTGGYSGPTCAIAPSPSSSPSPSMSPSPVSPSASPSKLASPSSSVSPTASPSTGASSSPTSSVVPTTSVTPSGTPSSSPSASPSTDGTSTSSSSSSSGSDKAADPVEGPALIAIVVIAAVAFLALVVAIGAFVYRRRRMDAGFAPSHELQVASS